MPANRVTGAKMDTQVKAPPATVPTIINRIHQSR